MTAMRKCKKRLDPDVLDQHHDINCIDFRLEASKNWACRSEKLPKFLPLENHQHSIRSEIVDISRMVNQPLL